MTQETLTPTANIMDIYRMSELRPENAIELYTKEITNLTADGSDWQRAFTLFMNRAIAYLQINDFANYKADLDKALAVNTREVEEDQKNQQAKNAISANTNLVHYHLLELKNGTGEIIKKKELGQANLARMKAEYIADSSLNNSSAHLDVLIPYHLQSASLFWEAAIAQNSNSDHFREATNHLLEAQHEVQTYVQANPTEYWAHMLHTKVIEAIIFLVPKLPGNEASRFQTQSFAYQQQFLLRVVRHNMNAVSLRPAASQIIDTKIA